MPKTSSIEISRLCWDQAKCSTCMSCMIVCAERHTGTSAPSRAHIRIQVGLFDGSYSAEYCRQCPDAACAEACPTQAIALAVSRSSPGDEQLPCVAWRVDDTLCIGCGACVDACPYHAIRMDAVTDLAAKCDLCLGATPRADGQGPGTQWCIEICPTKALTLE